MAYAFNPRERRTSVRVFAAAAAFMAITFLVPPPQPRPITNGTVDATGSITFPASAVMAEDIAVYGRGGELCWDLPASTSATGPRIGAAFGYPSVRVDDATYYPVGVVTGWRLGMPHTIKCSSSRVLVAKAWLLNPTVILLLRIADGLLLLLFGYVVLAGLFQRGTAPTRPS